MSAYPLNITPASEASPTLEQSLRFVDLSFECAQEAHRRMPTVGRRFQGDHAARNPAREALIRELRVEAMVREGLPMSLLPDPLPLSAFCDAYEGARHPLQSTYGMGGVS